MVLCFCHQSHCSREETVVKAFFPCDDTVRSALSKAVCRVFMFEEVVLWVMCVSDYAMYLLRAALCVNGVHRGKFCFYDPLCSLDHPLKSPPLCLGGITVPHSDTGCEDALHQTFVCLGQGVEAQAQASLPEQSDEVQPLLGLFHCGSGVCRPA